MIWQLAPGQPVPSAFELRFRPLERLPGGLFLTHAYLRDGAAAELTVVVSGGNAKLSGRPARTIPTRDPSS
jgi:hypothetical protein